MSGRNFSLKEMETTRVTSYFCPILHPLVRKELLSERDGNLAYRGGNERMIRLKSGRNFSLKEMETF